MNKIKKTIIVEYELMLTNLKSRIVKLENERVRGWSNSKSVVSKILGTEELVLLFINGLDCDDCTDVDNIKKYGLFEFWEFIQNLKDEESKKREKFLNDNSKQNGGTK